MFGINRIKKIIHIIEEKKRIEWDRKYHLEEKDLSDLPTLSNEEKNEIRSFWCKYPVKIEYKYWQYYTKKIGLFDYKYVPDNVWYSYVCPYFCDVEYARKIDDKCLYDILIKNIKMPKCILKKIDGRLLDEDYNSISIEEAKKEIEQYDRVMVKPSILVSGGKGIQIIEKKDYNSLENILDHYDNAVVQEMLRQSDCLNKINPSCINTIRISSLLLKDGTVLIPGAMLRMGTGGSKVDNASAGGIFAGINIEDGTLKEFAQARNGSLEKNKFLEHPDTHVKFEGYKLIGFEKVVKAIKNNAKYFPKTRLIGWDFCLDISDDPILVEVNLEGHGLESLQIANGAYFHDNLDKVLEEIEWSKVL